MESQDSGAKPLSSASLPVAIVSIVAILLIYFFAIGSPSQQGSTAGNPIVLRATLAYQEATRQMDTADAALALAPTCDNTISDLVRTDFFAHRNKGELAFVYGTSIEPTAHPDTVRVSLDVRYNNRDQRLHYLILDSASAQKK